PCRGRTLSDDVPSPLAETLAVVLLVATLGCAIVRPRGLPEAVVAVPAAGLLLVLGILPLGKARTDDRVSRGCPGPCQSVRSLRTVPGRGLLDGCRVSGQAGLAAGTRFR